LHDIPKRCATNRPKIVRPLKDPCPKRCKVSAAKVVATRHLAVYIMPASNESCSQR